MDFRDILVFLDASPDTEARLNLAISIAQGHAARLIGVDVTPPSAFDDGRWRDQATAIQESFDRAVGQVSGLDADYLVAGPTASGWKDFYAHYADLVIATQQDETNTHLMPKAIPEEVLLSAGTPMLILPPSWRSSRLGESVVLAWNPSREATRAAHDAVPVLMRAKKVTVFSFAPHVNSTDADLDLIVRHLRRHGVPAEAYGWPRTADMTPEAALFACLDSQDADLIVAGAYGHSRWFEGLFGGVGHDLLKQPTMPIFMSH